MIKPILAKAHIRKVAQSAWTRLKLIPPADLRAVCDFLKIKLIYEAPPNGSHGLWVRDKDGDTIFVNSALPHRLQRFVLAHELGHSIFQWGKPPGMIYGTASYGHNNALERNCDYFAIHLLMPDNVLRTAAKEVGHGPEYDRTAILASIFGVTYDLMKKRLRELNKGDSGKV